MTKERIEISGDQARGGVTGHGVRYVLMFGTVGAILALAAAWYFVS